ncbi:MAG: N-acetylmuramoyl-L-alanine amidase [Clostridia bacterium]|nr:N-acetylmuramoyl-L-alanine amidase [Clostridia bacterium]
MYSKNLFQSSVSFFVKFCISALLLLSAALGFGNLLFRSNVQSPANTASADEKITVVIDPGHGGRDGGALGEDGTREKDLNLAVALKLKAILESADLRVVMTRETDIELASPDSPHKKADDLKARLQLAQNQKNAIFVSIHMNQFPIEKYRGLQVYYSENHKESLTLAQTVQNKASEVLRNTEDRKIKPAGDSIYLMSHLQIPAVLVECGFLSNREERELLKNEAYQKKLALSLSAAILEYIASQDASS